MITGSASNILSWFRRGRVSQSWHQGWLSCVALQMTSSESGCRVINQLTEHRGMRTKHGAILHIAHHADPAILTNSRRLGVICIWPVSPNGIAKPPNDIPKQSDDVSKESFQDAGLLIMTAFRKIGTPHYLKEE